MREKLGPVGRDEAEAVAASALAFLAERPDLLGGFIATTGVEPSALRDRMSDPSFLAAAFDYLLSDEANAEAFCVAHDLSPERLMAARAALPGGDAPHWT